ncbi:MAG: AAA family ATPase [Saprospiraceae bacterium]|nr:AAA family ATPase [Saprospiraceae bacterium]
MNDPLILSEDFQEALDLMELTTHHVFLTGKAGTGKSTLLQLFRRTTQKKVVVLAPTGVAALNVQGQTIHSFFSFPPKLMASSELKIKKTKRIFKVVETIVIDEISMVRAEILDHIDLVLRMARQNAVAFGGVQMIFIGDLFQLPPVVASHYERSYFSTTYPSPYFFSARVFSSGLRYETIELHVVYRQEERRFVNLLDAIRTGDVDDELLAELNERVGERPPDQKDFITLTTKNVVAQRINQRELDQIEELPYSFPAEIKGHFNPALYPTDIILRLKKGAQVMLLRNDPGKKYVNGTIGVIDSLTKDKIKVRIENQRDDEVVDVNKQEWELIKYHTPTKSNVIQTEVVGSFIQFPLKLAWAITVHKSQGKTFDHVEVDLAGGAFEHGQTYVALSRCRSLEGIILRQPVKYRDILIDEQVIDFYQRVRRL